MGTRLYVGNLSLDTTEDSLRKALSEEDRGVRAVSLVLERDTGRPRGFAFVEMANDDDAQAAIKALDGAELDGRNLKVNEAHARLSRSASGGARAAGGGREKW